MVDRLERRIPLLAADPDIEQPVRFLVLHHQRASQYERSWTDSAVRRFAREMGAHLDDAICLARADITTKRPERKRRGLGQIEQLCGRIAQLAAEDSRQPLLPKGIGNVIMRTLGLPPSRRIGDIKRALEARVEAGELPALADEATYAQYIEAHRAELETAGAGKTGKM